MPISLSLVPSALFQGLLVVVIRSEIPITGTCSIFVQGVLSYVLEISELE